MFHLFTIWYISHIIKIQSKFTKEVVKILEKPEFEVKFYDTADGSRPAEDFILSLLPKMRAKVLRLIDILETNGTELMEPFSKHLGDGIFELRGQTGSDISRVLFFFMAGKKAILTHGFIKKTKKTPPSEIKLAKKFRAEYLSREENQQ